MTCSHRLPRSLLALGALLWAGCQTGGPEAQPALRPLGSLAVVGASISSGFGLETEAGTVVRLADIVSSALLVDHGPVADASDLRFFLAPRETGERVVAAALAARPAAVLAIDFLFWFSYGGMPSEDDRLRRLEEGLALLGRIDAPCVVGDMPDMSDAVGTMLAAGQVPRPATLAAMNGRIRAWAAGRANVSVLGLAEFVAQLRAGEAVRVGPIALTKAEVLFPDHLHTTLLGSAALVVMGLEAVAAAHPDAVPPAAFRHDPREIVAALGAALAAGSQPGESDEGGGTR